MAELKLGKVRGLSAYEISVQNGYEGTEQEWVNYLKAIDGTRATLNEKPLTNVDFIGDSTGVKSINGFDIVADGSIKARKTDFLKADNMFDGVYYQGLYITGDNNAYLQKNDNYYVIAFNVKPNTQYTFLKPQNVGQEDGYYWWKMRASTNEDYKSIINSVASGTAYTFDGTVNGSITNAETNKFHFTTGANDKSVFILISKYQKPYIEICEGIRNVALYSNYNDCILPTVGIYSKKEADEKITKSVQNIFIKAQKGIRLKKYNNGVLILYPNKNETKYIGYYYGVYNLPEINVNTLRLINTKVYDSELNELYLICTDYHDMEGVVKINGEADYIGSVHGDEVMDSFIFRLNGITADIGTDRDSYYESVEFIVKSNVFHADTTNKAFTHYKITKFDIDGVHITNKWIAEATTTLTHARSCLLSIMKYSGDTKLVKYYGDDKVVMMPQLIPEPGQNKTILANPKIDNISIFGDVISANLKSVYRGGSETGYFSEYMDFNERIKGYIDCYTGLTVNSGEEIYTKSFFRIQLN